VSDAAVFVGAQAVLYRSAPFESSFRTCLRQAGGVCAVRNLCSVVRISRDESLLSSEQILLF